MTSKIVVNNIEADAGVSTVTFGSKISSTEFVGPVVGNVTGNLTGTASTATAATTAYGLSGSPTLSGITSVSTSNLTVNGTAYPNAGPLSNRNLIINGAMQVAQRGTSSTATNGYGTVDRWKDASSGGGITQSQQALTTGDPYNEGFRNFYRLANTTGTTGASDTREINTNLEAQDIANSGWQYTSSTSYITLSFWVRASVTQTYYGTLRTYDSAVYDYGFSFALTADTWTKITKTIPGNSNLVFNNDNGQGLKLALVPFYGTNYTDSGYTLDAWAANSAGSQLPDFTTTWANTNGATFDITGVQLEVGSVATPFEHRSYGDELRRCQRYYWNLLLEKGQTDLYLGNATQYNSSTIFMTLHPPVTMRTEPSLDVSNGTSHFATLANDTAVNFDTWAIDGRSGAAAVTVNATVSGTTGHSLFVRSQNTSAKFSFSAEM